VEGPALTEGAIVSSREVSRMPLEAKRLRDWEMRSSSYTEERKSQAFSLLQSAGSSSGARKSASVARV
jgi:hypothetical protein